MVFGDNQRPGDDVQYLRHDNHAEIQPVPWIPQEGEWPDAESSRQNFYQRLKRVDPREGVPRQEANMGKKKGWRNV